MILDYSGGMTQRAAFGLNSGGITSPSLIRFFIRFRKSVSPLTDRFLKISAGEYSTIFLILDCLKPFVMLLKKLPYSLRYHSKA
jgi:hypothetical protein